MGPTGENTSFPTFSWTAVSGATNIALYLINKGTGAFVVAKEDIAGNATSYTLTNGDLAGGLPQGDYRFWINSISTNGYSQSGAPTDFSVGAAAVMPSVPTVTGTTGAANQPTVNWTAGSGLVTYSVYLINRGTNTVVASQSGIATSSFTPAAPLADGIYRIWVNATNAAGTSAWSTPFDFDVGTPVVVPATPSVTGITGLANQPTVNWNLVSGATSYGVYFINLDTGALVTSQTGIGTNSFTPASALGDGRYRIWVNATNIAGSSAWSTPFDFSVGTPLTMPTVPANLSASNTNTSTPTVTWTAQTAGTKYAIWFINLDTNVLVSGQENLTTASYTPSSPLANGHYRIWVRAYNSLGSSGWSNPFDFIVAA
jgi:predicted phage tail protein